MKIRHSVSVASDEDYEFECVHCGASARVRIVSEGVGMASRGALTGQQAAEDATHAALDDARIGVFQDAQRKLSMMRCPRCGRRGPGWSRFVTRAALYAVVSLAVAALGLWVRLGTQAGAEDWICPVTGFLPIVATLIWALYSASSADSGPELAVVSEVEPR